MATKKKPAAKKTTSTKKAAKKAPAKKAAKKAPAKKAAKKTPAKKAAKKAPAKKTAKKAPAQKTAKTEQTMTTTLAGAAAPGFRLQGDDGKTHDLQDHKGAPVVIYFYPRDDTPGCTVEACDFRDNMARAQKAGAVVYGVSRDSLKSHEKFKAKYNLNFTLLSDPDLTVHKAYGAWGKKVMYGKEVEGTIRSTFLIDGKGVLRQAWPKVKVDGHVDAVLAALAAL
jgi:peroxiredoxin Q/BCP